MGKEEGRFRIIEGFLRRINRSPVDSAIRSHNLEEFTKYTDQLDPKVRWIVLNAGLDLDLLMRKWRGIDSWADLWGKRVLDLASGSSDPEWPPTFARLCTFNGAYVTVVDIKPQNERDIKTFKSITADLVTAVTEGKLGELVGEEKYDIIHSSFFVGYNPAPELWMRTVSSKFSIEDFQKLMFCKAFDLLSEGGVISLGEKDSKGGFIVQTKKDGKPVCI